MNSSRAAEYIWKVLNQPTCIASKKMTWNDRIICTNENQVKRLVNTIKLSQSTPPQELIEERLKFSKSKDGIIWADCAENGNKVKESKDVL